MYYLYSSTNEDKRNYGIIHHFMMNYCKDKAIQLFDEIISDRVSVGDEVYYRTRGQKIALLSNRCILFVGEVSRSI